MSPHQLVRRWPSIVALTLVGIAVAAVLISTAPQRYAAHADVLIDPPPGESTQAVAPRALASTPTCWAGALSPRESSRVWA